MPSEKSFRRHLCVMRTITLCLGKANRTYAGFVARRGHYPALESAHALAYALRRAERLPADKRLLVNLSGRGDKDIDYVLEKIGLE